MATGYTYRIVSGEITTFPEFAKICMRAFGACMHMKEDSLDKDYEEDKPSDYHVKQIETSQRELNRIRTLSDEQIIEEERKKLEDENKYWVDSLQKSERVKKTTLKMIEDCEKWTPPTDEHREYKKFMLEQLRTVLLHDCDISYAVTHLEKLDIELKNINPAVVREAKIKNLQERVNSSIESYKKDVISCAKSNKWVHDILDSL